MDSKSKNTLTKAEQAVEKEKRLAEALRKNLRRRKAQKRQGNSNTNGANSQ